MNDSLKSVSYLIINNDLTHHLVNQFCKSLLVSLSNFQVKKVLVGEDLDLLVKNIKF